MSLLRRHGTPLLVALALGAAGCGGPAPEPAPTDTANVTNFLGSADGDAGFTRADAPRRFRFPEDHGAHPDYRSEWWYLTGNLSDETGRHFGYQLTFFRFALAAERAVRNSAWATDQLWMAHFAVTDTRAERFHSAERFERQALGLAGAEAAPFRVWLADWELASTGDRLFPLELRARSGEVSLALVIDAGKPLVLQGEDGLDPKGPEPGNASYYYSFTRLPSRGTLDVGGERFALSGDTWMDREWSTSVLGPDLEGWNWFALQLDDGSDLMYYRLRRKDGGTSPYSGGILVAPDGTVTARFAAADASLEPAGDWLSPATGIRYTVAWRLSVPGLGLELDIRPRLPDQEMDLAVRYWEGAVTATGRRGDAPVAGVGYAEHAGVSTRP